MNVAPAPVMLAETLSPASAGAFAPGALASPVCAWLPDGWHAATNSSVDSASAVVRKMDVFMWAPVGWRSAPAWGPHMTCCFCYIQLTVCRDRVSGAARARKNGRSGVAGGGAGRGGRGGAGGRLGVRT